MLTLLLTAAQVAALQPGGMTEMFVSACAEGQVRLGKQQASAVEWNELPAQIKRFRSFVLGATVLKIREPGNGWLIVYDTPKEKRCAIAASERQLSMKSIKEALSRRYPGVAVGECDRTCSSLFVHYPGFSLVYNKISSGMIYAEVINDTNATEN